MRTAKQYKLKPSFAQGKGLPNNLIAIQLKETTRAVYLYGHASVQNTVQCVKCGRTLTHPISKLTGIGPECGKHFWDESVLGPYGFTEEHAETLRRMVQETTVDGWIPKSCIVQETPVAEKITAPTDHPVDNDKITKKPNQPKTATLVGDRVMIQFPYNPETIANIKTLSGRRFHKNPSPFWTAPFSLETAQRLREWGFELDKALEERTTSLEKSAKAAQEAIQGKGKENEDIQIPGLRAYQRQGVAVLNARNGRAIIGDEMGLGKTAQALAWLEDNPEARPALIVVPASLKINWAREAQQWMKNPDIYVINGHPKKDRRWQDYRTTISGDDGPIIVINYDILSRWQEHLPQPKTLIVDEAQYIKNKAAKRTKAVKKIGKKAKHIICLSGTPIVNRPVEFFPALNLVEPGLFPSFWKFAHRYCGAYHNGWGWDFSGATNTEELHEIVTDSGVMIRRLKSDVLTELPAKQRVVVPMSPDNNKEYRKAEKELIRWISATKGDKAAWKASQAEALARFSYLKQLAAQGKMTQSVEWIRDYLESGQKLVVFAVHHAVIDQLAEEFQGTAVRVDGRVSQTKRQEAVDRFQNDPKIRLFIGNIRAAGTGLTLTAAQDTVTLELGWTPGEHDQAEDRVHRIGQEAESVTAYYLVASDTIEEEIVQLLDQKRQVLSQVLDGQDADDNAMLSLLMERYS